MKWSIKRISSIATTFEDGDWIESKDQSHDGIRLIQTGNIGNGFFKERSDKARFISEDTFNKMKCTEVFQGDILISRLPDPVGRACIVPQTGKKLITAVDCTIIRVNLSEIIPQWLLYFTKSDGYQKEVQVRVTGATRKRISRRNLGLIPIPLPPLPEQQRIVAILDQAFAAMDKAKANLERNIENAKELFESYLQGVFERKGDGWEERILEECFKMKSGDNLTAKNMTEGDYAVFGGNGIAGYHNEYNLSGSNVIIGRVGALCGNVRYITENIWLTDNAFKVVDFKFDFDHSFLTYLLNHKDLRSYARQAAQPVISNSSLKDVVLYFPKSITEQQIIVRELDTLRTGTQKLASQYQKKLDNLDELKKAILEKAFKGELTTK